MVTTAFSQKLIQVNEKLLDTQLCETIIFVAQGEDSGVVNFELDSLVVKYLLFF